MLFTRTERTKKLKLLKCLELGIYYLAPLPKDDMTFLIERNTYHSDRNCQISTTLTRHVFFISGIAIFHQTEWHNTTKKCTQAVQNTSAGCALRTTVLNQPIIITACDNNYYQRKLSADKELSINIMHTTMLASDLNTLSNSKIRFLITFRDSRAHCLSQQLHKGYLVLWSPSH